MAKKAIKFYREASNAHAEELARAALYVSENGDNGDMESNNFGGMKE
jgi:hypothetical protein